MDDHFRTSPFGENIPVMLGLTGVWNTTFLGYPSLAILPYTQALSKLAPHIQQVRPASALHSLSPGIVLSSLGSLSAKPWLRCLMVMPASHFGCPCHDTLCKDR